MPLTDEQMKSMVQWVQIGQVAVPIIVSTVTNLIAYLKSKDVDPSVYQFLQDIIDAKQAEADAEAAAHGHPHK